MISFKGLFISPSLNNTFLLSYVANANGVTLIGSSQISQMFGNYSSGWGMICADSNANQYLVLMRSTGYWAYSCQSSTRLSSQDWADLNTALDSPWDSSVLDSNTVFPVDENNVIDLSHPVINASANQSVSGNYNYFISYNIDIPEPDPEPSGSDLSGVISAITLIPATLLVIAFLSIIYRIFINRRVRS